MVKVFITVDTEVWPKAPTWRATALRDDLRRDIYGATAAGNFGVPYQLDILDEYELKGVFFVEALFADAVGIQPLRDLVQLIQGRGHEVQLHLHTEWLDWLEPSPLPGRHGQNMKDFAEDEQDMLIAHGLRKLRAAGAQNVCAFRAGNYGANFATLRALARNGITFDTSHNTCYLRAECGLDTSDLCLQPRLVDNVWEFPVSFFRDLPGHYRHAQLVACSSREMENALLDARRHNWYSFVIVSHSFEMLCRRGEPRPDRIVVKRFEKLCKFLAKNREKFQTCGFADIDPTTIPEEFPTEPLVSDEIHTVWRAVEQLARRVI
jgi:hypothetical protein